MAAKQRQRPQPALKLKVHGPKIRPGRIPIPALVVICQQAQAAVNRQAEALEGRKQTLHQGPRPAAIQKECTLELVSIGKGSPSAVLGFDQAKAQSHLPIGNLGEHAIETVVDAIDALAKGKADGVDAGVLDSLGNMGELFSKKAITSIEWIVPGRRGSRKRRSALYTAAVYTQVSKRLKPPKTEPLVVYGVLEMADFKVDDQRCRIHPTLGPPVNCTFDAEQADEIYGLLRRVVKVEGDATINSQSGKQENVHIVSVAPVDPLAVDAGAFFKGWTFDQLARLQAVEPLRDASELAGGWPDDEDIEEFIEETYRHRD